jgi:cytochrome c peroxidase
VRAAYIAATLVLAAGWQQPLGLDRYLPIPDGAWVAPEMVELGRLLFHDSRLSRDGSVSCATCHEPSQAFTDGRRLPLGAGGSPGSRNAPTLVNRVYGRTFFWDGRADTLDRQAMGPLLNPTEMGGSVGHIAGIVRSDPVYRDRFAAFFDGEPGFQDVVRAIAAYVRTIRSGSSSYDRFNAGDRTALSAEERRGYDVFFGRGECYRCHRGPTLTDERFHNTGVAWQPAAADPSSAEANAATAAGSESRLSDVGRFLVTGRDADRGAFKTPTLREVARTAPYMHDGSFATLEEVVDFYAAGGRPNPWLDADIRPLGIDAADRRALVAFLRTLSGEIVEGVR